MQACRASTQVDPDYISERRLPFFFVLQPGYRLSMSTGMRQIYLLASDADAEASMEIENLLKQRGYLVRRADERMAYPPARPGEITLALWSRAVQFSSRQILFTNRAIDAWTDGRLICARLDHTLLPRGLGDVTTIDLTFQPARMAGVWRIVEAAQVIDRALGARRAEAPPSSDSGSGGGGEAAPSPEAKAKRRKARAKVFFATGLALAVGPVVAALLGSTAFLTMPAAPIILLILACLSWGALAGVVAGFAAARREAPGAEEEAASPAAPAPLATREVAAADEAPEGAAQVFVSYSRRDGPVVYPLVEEVERAGRDVWIDRDGIDAGGNWAGLIVRAIRESDTFCLMCSAEAFQSDNVRREIYIADKYKRKLVPVRLDFAEMPEDFEYFLIDRQWLDLTGVDPAERASRLKAILVR